MDDAQVADIKKLILDVVTALQGINEEAFSAYLYAREIDLALQKVAEIATQFRAALGEIHANEKIPEIALVKKSHAESQRVLAQVIEIAKVICGSDINFQLLFYRMSLKWYESRVGRRQKCRHPRRLRCHFRRWVSWGSKLSTRTR